MLGRMGGSGDLSFKRIRDPKVSLMESSYSSSGSSKRAKAPSNATHIASCLVDGCNSDLSRCREYHRRHKVCEVHSKSPKVTIRGLEQRFCQQCSRFHSLVEFDEGKRSCRKRLDGHNRRRRKPRPESLSRNAGKFLSQQGATMLSFGCPTLLPCGMLNSAWAGLTVKAENSAIPYMNCINTHNNFHGSLACGFGGNQFKALHDNGPPLAEPSACQRLLDPNSASGNSSHGQKMFSDDGLSPVIDSVCALSLLSSAQAETQEIALNHMVPPNPIPSASQSLVPSVRHHGDLSQQYSQGVESKLVVSILSYHDADNVNLHCQGMFRSGADGSFASSD